MIAEKKTYEFKRPSPYDLTKQKYTLEELSVEGSAAQNNLLFFDRVENKALRDAIAYLTKFKGER